MRSSVMPHVLQAGVGLGQRAFVRTAALAGLWLAGFFWLAPTMVSAAPCLTSGFQGGQAYSKQWGQVNGNFHIGPFAVTSQAGSSFSGTIYGDPLIGTITGTPGSGPITVVLVRQLQGGTPQVWIGTYAETGKGTCTFDASSLGGQMMMSGVFYHHGEGPSPWFVTGSYGALSPR
jgi:hypothetical protein